MCPYKDPAKNRERNRKAYWKDVEKSRAYNRAKISKPKYKRQRKLYLLKNAKRLRAKRIIWEQKNIENRREYNRKWTENNREHLSKYHRKYNQKHKAHQKQLMIEWHKSHPNYLKEQHSNYYKKNKELVKEKVIKYRRIRYGKDLKFKLKCLLRTQLLNRFKRYSTTGKLQNSLKYGIDWNVIVKKLKVTLPKDYKEREYHIDHIIPCYYFNFGNTKEVKKCFSPDNIQWLPAEENRVKHNRIVNKIENKRSMTPTYFSVKQHY